MEHRQIGVSCPCCRRVCIAHVSSSLLACISQREQAQHLHDMFAIVRRVYASAVAISALMRVSCNMHLGRVRWS